MFSLCQNYVKNIFTKTELFTPIDQQHSYIQIYIIIINNGYPIIMREKQQQNNHKPHIISCTYYN